MKKNIRFLLFFLAIGLFLSWPIHSLYSKLNQPIEAQQLVALDQIANDFLNYAKKGILKAHKSGLCNWRRSSRTSI